MRCGSAELKYHLFSIPADNSTNTGTDLPNFFLVKGGEEIIHTNSRAILFLTARTICFNAFSPGYGYRLNARCVGTTKRNTLYESLCFQTPKRGVYGIVAGALFLPVVQKGCSSPGGASESCHREKLKEGGRGAKI